LQRVAVAQYPAFGGGVVLQNGMQRRTILFQSADQRDVLAGAQRNIHTAQLHVVLDAVRGFDPELMIDD
jgi:hypothetical protein